MKRKLALLLTLLLTLSLVNFIPAAASADMDTTVTLGDFVVTYDSASPIEASFDEANRLLLLKATSPAKCEVSLMEGLTVTNCDILAEGELYIVLKGVDGNCDLSLAAGSDVTLEPQGRNDLADIKTSATAQSPAALTITGTQAEGNSLLTCIKVSLANASLTVSGGELGAFNGMTCSHFYMWSGMLTINKGTIYCNDINLSGGDLKVISTFGISALSSAPKLDYHNGYYWCANRDAAGLPNTLTDGAQAPYVYSPEHIAVRFVAKDALISVTAEGTHEQTKNGVEVNDGGHAIVSMEKDIGVAVPYSLAVNTSENSRASLETHDLNIEAYAYQSEGMTYYEPVLAVHQNSTADFFVFGDNTFTSTGVTTAAVNLASGSELNIGATQEGTDPNKIVKELGDFVVTYDKGADITASIDPVTEVTLTLSSQSGAACEVRMKAGVSRTGSEIIAEGKIHLKINGVSSGNALVIAAGSDVTLEILTNSVMDIHSRATADVPSALTIISDKPTNNSWSGHTVSLPYTSLTMSSGSLKVTAFGITCSALHMQGGKIDVNGGIDCDDIRLSGGDLTAKNTSGSVFASAPKLNYPNGYLWGTSDTYALPQTLTDGAVTPYEYSDEHKAVRLVAKDAPKNAPVRGASTANGVSGANGVATSSGTLTINAAGAGFDGTGKLTLNNLPLTITSGTGKAFGSLTNVELNYPNGYIWRASKTGEYHNSSDAPFVLDDYTYVEILPIIPDMFEGADGYITRTYEDWLRDQAEKDLMAPPSGLQPDPTTEPEDLFAD